jgi:DNA replication protein DnaC
MQKFKVAASEGTVDKVVKHYLKYKLLVVDEIGYLPVDKDSVNGFFQLVTARYERRPMIITSNLPPI